MGRGTSWNHLSWKERGDANNKYTEDRETQVFQFWRKGKKFAWILWRHRGELVVFNRLCIGFPRLSQQMITNWVAKNNRNLFFTILEPKIKVLTCPYFFWRILPCPFQLLISPGIPRLVVMLPKAEAYEQETESTPRACHGLHSTHDLSLTNLHMQRTYFQIKVHSKVLGGRNLGGTLFSSILRDNVCMYVHMLPYITYLCPAHWKIWKSN